MMAVWRRMDADDSSLLSRMRDCCRRADDARALGDSVAYRRLVEEYLFLCHACARPDTRRAASAPKLPHLIVLHERQGVVHLLREAFIEHGFAAHLEHAATLDKYCNRLDHIDPSRATLLVIAAKLSLDAGLSAISRTRGHAKGRDCPVLALSFHEEVRDEKLALASGATAFMAFPAVIGDFADLTRLVRAMVDVAVISRGSELG